MICEAEPLQKQVADQEALMISLRFFEGNSIRLKEAIPADLDISYYEMKALQPSCVPAGLIPFRENHGNDVLSIRISGAFEASSGLSAYLYDTFCFSNSAFILDNASSHVVKPSTFVVSPLPA